MLRVLFIFESMRSVEIRPIRQEDNAALAKIIRTVLTEFNAAKPGTVFYDPSGERIHA